MKRSEDGRVRQSPPDPRQNGTRVFCVQTLRRLIQKQDTRLAQKDSGDAEATGLPA